MFKYRIRQNHRHGTDDTIGIDQYELHHRRELTQMAIGSHYHPVSMFPTDIQLCGDILPHHAELQSNFADHGMFVAVYLSGRGGRGSSMPAVGISDVIIQASEGKNVSQCA
jgi:hypothetical protein